MIEFRNITKRFGLFTALSDVTFASHRGSVHAITGENGAGKSTLMKILAGVHLPDTGEIICEGKVVKMHGPSHARTLRVATVFQELTLLPNLTIAENLFLGREPRWLGMIDRSEMRRQARVALDRIGIEMSADTPCGELTVGEQHLIEIAKSAVIESDVVIYDEPTAALDAPGVAKLQRLITEQKTAGKLIYYISHRLEEIFATCDTVTVLKDGAHVRTCPTTELTRDSLVSLMVGRDVGELYPPRPSGTFARVPKLSTSGLVVAAGAPEVTISICAGEIVGLAGLEGQGQRELIRVIAGLMPAHAGKRFRHGADGSRLELPASINGVVNSDIGFVPEDRKTEGLYLSLSIAQNIGLGGLRRQPLWARARDDRDGVAALIASMNISARDDSQAVGSLSGGNQQKVMIGRWLGAGIDILLIEEPTRGVDVGAKAEIYRLLRQFTDSGGSVLMTSSELTEHLGVCDRILVVRGGGIVADLVAGDVNEEVVARYALMGRSEAGVTV